MSSYFDEIGRQIYEAECVDDAEKVRRLLDTAKQRVAGYFSWVEKNALKSEREKVTELRTKYVATMNKGVRYSASYFVSGALHELGHDIGRAQIRIRGGRVAGDNPYFPGNFGI